MIDPHPLTVRAYPRGASPQILRDTDTATADPHVPELSVRVAQFFEE